MCFYVLISCLLFFFFFFQAEDGIRDIGVTGVQTCALPISGSGVGDVELWHSYALFFRLRNRNPCTCRFGIVMCTMRFAKRVKPSARLSALRKALGMSTFMRRCLRAPPPGTPNPKASWIFFNPALPRRCIDFKPGSRPKPFFTLLPTLESRLLAPFPAIAARPGSPA